MSCYGDESRLDECPLAWLTDANRPRHATAAQVRSGPGGSCRVAAAAACAVPERAPATLWRPRPPFWPVPPPPPPCQAVGVDCGCNVDDSGVRLWGPGDPNGEWNTEGILAIGVLGKPNLGTICDDGTFSDQMARIACQQMGVGNWGVVLRDQASRDKYKSHDSLPAHIVGEPMVCTGGERMLQDCYFKDWCVHRMLPGCCARWLARRRHSLGCTLAAQPRSSAPWWHLSTRSLPLARRLLQGHAQLDLQQGSRPGAVWASREGWRSCGVGRPWMGRCSSCRACPAPRPASSPLPPVPKRHQCGGTPAAPTTPAALAAATAFAASARTANHVSATAAVAAALLK